MKTLTLLTLLQIMPLRCSGGQHQGIGNQSILNWTQRKMALYSMHILWVSRIFYIHKHTHTHCMCIHTATPVLLFAGARSEVLPWTDLISRCSRIRDVHLLFPLFHFCPTFLRYLFLNIISFDGRAFRHFLFCVV